MPSRRPPRFPSGEDSPRKPTRDELRVWDYVTRDDQRLPDAHIDWQAVGEAVSEALWADSPKSAESRQARPSDDQLDSLIRKTGFGHAGAAHPIPPETRADGVDSNSARRLRQGKLPVEATLDMHGMYREEAWQALADFIRHGYNSGKRCVLVITGKGRFHAADDTRESGVLKRSLPRWLAAPPIAPLVLDYAQAQPRHGGDGAVYILLRRRR